MLRELFSDAQLTIVQDAVNRGVAFRSFAEVSIPASGGSQYFAITLGDKDTALFSRIISADRNNVRYEVLAGAAVASYGADVPIYRMSQKVGGVSKHRIRQCTISNPGAITVVDVDVVRGAAGQGNRTTGSTFTPDDFRVYDRKQEIIVRAVNPDTVDPANFLLYLKWIEFNWP